MTAVPELFVAVCTDRPGPPRSLPEGALLVRETERGLAVARNEALVAAGRADVLVLLADDAEVGERWWEQVRSFWAGAPDDVAALGGPSVVRVATRRPAWADDEALGLRDCGPFPVDLDPRDSLPATAVSFRTAALRGAGGFWPARGHPLGHGWYSDLHAAQQELARAGWRVRYEPALVATRVPHPDELRVVGHLRRRFRYGARLGSVGGERDAGPALSEAVSEARAVLPAALRPPRKEAVHHAARAAEAASVLLAPVASHRERQPVAASTPLRRHIAAPQPLVPRPRRRRRRAAAQGGALVLLYHRVAEERHDPLRLCVAPDRFGEQLDVLRAEREVVALDDLVDALRSGSVPPRAVAITFDDGYRDNAEEADRRLADAGLPATLFATTQHVEDGRPFWWDELPPLLREADPGRRPLHVDVDGAPRAYVGHAAEQRERIRLELNPWLPTLRPDQAARAAEQVRAWSGVELPEQRPGPMTREQLLSLKAFSLGSHTRRHPSLRFRAEPEQRAEIAVSREELAAWTGSAPRGFAYPFGMAGSDFDARTVRLVRESGYDHAVTIRPGARVAAGTDPFAIPRTQAPDVGGAEFSRWLAALG